MSYIMKNGLSERMLKELGFACRKTGYDKEKREDAIGAKTFDDGTSIVVVADGLGSHKKSDIGAKIAVDTTIDFLHDVLPEVLESEEKQKKLSTALLRQIYLKISEQAEKDGGSIKDYSSTLLFYASYGNEILMGQIGDGYVGVQEYGNPDVSIIFPSKDEGIEYSNVTRTIFSNPSFMHIKKFNRSDINCIFLSSDGIDKFSYGGRTVSLVNPKAGQQRTGTYGRVNKGLSQIINQFTEDYKKERISSEEYVAVDLQTMDEILNECKVWDDLTFAFICPNERGEIIDICRLLKIIQNAKKRQKPNQDNNIDI